MKYSELMKLLQDTLKMSDLQFADYLKTDATTVRRVRAGTAEIPAHTKMLLLDRGGFIKITKLAISIFPPAAQAKLHSAINNQTLNPAQQKALEELQKAIHSQEME